MELEQTTTSSQVTIKYGLILGLALIGNNLLFYILTGNDSKNYTSLIVMLVIMIVALLFGMQSRKNDTLGGYMSYGQGLGAASMILLYASLLVAVYQIIFIKLIDPDFMVRLYDKSKAEMLQNNYSEEQIEQGLKVMQMMQNPFIMFFSSLFNVFIMGFLLSLILSIFTSKANPDAEYQKLS